MGSLTVSVSANMTNSTDDFLRVGKIGKAVGLKGEVYVISYTDIPQVRFASGAIARVGESPDKTLTITSSREHNGRLIVRFREISSREDAENLRDTELYAERFDEEDAFYLDDLVGCDAKKDDMIIGKVTAVINNAAQDLLEIRLIDTQKRVLVPFVESIVPQVSIETKTVTITPPEGLLEL